MFRLFLKNLSKGLVFFAAGAVEKPGIPGVGEKPKPVWGTVPGFPEGGT